MKNNKSDIILNIYIILGFFIELLIYFKYVFPDIRLLYYGIIGTPLVLYKIIKSNKFKLN